MENNKGTIIGFAAMGGLFLLFVVFTLIYYLSGDQKDVKPSQTEIDALKSAAIAGSLEDASKLSAKRGDDAILAMREVLEDVNVSDEKIKIAMVMGLGPGNKHFESVPLFLNIMKKDDKLWELRMQANVAAVACGISDHFYHPAENIDFRLEKVQKMLDEYNLIKKRKDKEAAGLGGGQAG